MTVALYLLALIRPDNTPAHAGLQDLVCVGKRDQVGAWALDIASAGDPEGFIALRWLEESARPASPTRVYADCPVLGR